MRTRPWTRGAWVLVGLAGLTACATGDGRELPAADAVGTTTVLDPDASVVQPGATVSAPAGMDGDPAGSSDDVTPVGFGRASATITSADGEVCDLCLWVADTPELRSRGLMAVTDLGAADGMIFRYGEEHSTQFWMRDTKMPLSIAFFGGDGAFLDAFDMSPCTTEACPRYDSPRGFYDAIEFPQGTLDDFLVGPGSVLDVSDLPCA